MTRAELLKLAERVEALTGPDGHADLDIAHVLNLPMCFLFTASLDAAMGLVPEGSWIIVKNVMGPQPMTRDLFEADVLPPMGKDRPVRLSRLCPTPALALTAAALRARAEGVA